MPVPSQKRGGAGRKRPASKTPRPGVVEVDPVTVSEINALFMGYIKRMGLTVGLMVTAAVIIILLSQPSRTLTPMFLLCSITVGLLISYRRGVGRVFDEVKRIGVDRARQRRYADAVYALEHFHLIGNRGFDRDGEAHYALLLAYQATGRQDRARQIAEWMQRHRRRSPYLSRAEEALARASSEPPAV